MSNPHTTLRVVDGGAGRPTFRGERDTLATLERITRWSGRAEQFVEGRTGPPAQPARRHE